ncbi:MAG: 16S rRNA (cytidine(1402)-2'-O)-methyltransferase [bacterium]
MNLYIIATPIGNLEDITLRALRILKEVDIIFCEDTRTTRVLLKHYEITTPTDSFYAQSKLSKIDKIINLLKEGKNLALVSDAGTPAISDPGSILVAKIREEIPEAKIIPIPGASSLTAAFSASGVLGGEFTFLGFLPHKKGRETLFKEIAESKRPYIFFESPHRIEKTLESLKKFAPTKKIVIGRELTKIYEEFLLGTAEEIQEIFKNKPEKIRGEFVVIVY